MIENKILDEKNDKFIKRLINIYIYIYIYIYTHIYMILDREDD